MDTQRKKGVLDVCVLSVLKKGPSYGYELIGEVSKCIDISESTLYPILKRLENSECLTTYRQEHNGRIRKYYQITPTGEKRIKDFLDEWEEMKRIYEFVKENHQEEAK
ncbi:MAG: PadR family transcriptional regulator [Eubacteriales bacterium]|nr:PadR family transcriptional regulator [Eubacteriales bacterium]